MKTPRSTSSISFRVWKSSQGRRSGNAENAHSGPLHLSRYYFLISLAGKSQFISSMKPQLSAVTWRAITRSRLFSLADSLIHFHIQADYLTWAERNNFKSKLPKDCKAQKEKQKGDSQTRLDAHLEEKPSRKHTVAYSDELFRKTAIEWLIATDQVSSFSIFPSSGN